MSGKKPKIDLVKIGLDGIDILSDINETGPTPLIDFAGMKLKSLKPKEDFEGKIATFIEKLISINPNGFMTKDEIIRSFDIAESDLNRFLSKVRSYLRRDGQWVLQRNKKSGVYQYYVIRYS